MTTTVQLQRQSICAGGDHVVISVTVGAAPAKDYSIEIARAIQPLAALTDEERETILIGLMQLHCRGMTKAQANAELLAGVTLVI